MSIALLELNGRRTPFIRQSEASECALACLAMVAAYHGYKTDLVALRQRFSVSLKGATLKQLMHVAEEIGFHARPLRGEPVDLPHLALPAILHWNLVHFVVLTRISRTVGNTWYHVHDPAGGVRRLSDREFSQGFTGIALELIKSENFKPKVERVTLGLTQLWSSMTGFWQTMLQLVLLSLVLQVAALALPFYLQIAVDTALPASDMDLLSMLAVGFGGLAVITLLTGWLRSLVLVTLNNSLIYQIVVNLFRHMTRLPLPWFEKRHVGDIVSRFGSTQPVAQLLSQGMIAGFLDGFMALLSLALMFVYSATLGVLALAALALYAGVRIAFLHALRLRNVDAITAAARENSLFIESIRGIAGIKAFGQEGNRQRLWQRAKADAVNAQIKLGRLTAAFEAIGQFVLASERVLFVYLAVSLALKGGFTVGMIFAFQAYKQQFLDASTRLIEQAMNFNILKVHLSRISDIVLSRQEQDARPATSELPDFDGPIELENVRYRYGANEEEVLRGVTLTIRPGEMVALVGPSGGGKTTLAKILTGLFEPVGGRMLINGRPASSFSPVTLRRQIGTVAQEDALYAGSLAENIAFFDPEMDLARVEEVARIACIHEEINRMPMRYETLIGDMGSVLSGGQKQRVLLARALYARPRLLVLDEGTAHLDPENERRVLEALRELDISRVLVAHRPQSVAAADRVILVRNGTVTELRNRSAVAEATG